MVSIFHKVIKRSEKVTGLTAKQIRDFSPEELRAHIELRNKSKIQFVSEFPIIGRGNVLRDDIVSKESLDADIDRILSRN